MSVPLAFIFDLNGTMVDDMDYHFGAWYNIINEQLRANLSVAAVKKEMYGKNSEVLDRIFGEGAFSPEKVQELSDIKEQKYREAYSAHVKLITGLKAFMERARAASIPMAIGSAAIRANIDLVLDKLEMAGWFGAIVSADDVLLSKPNPETFLKAASVLGVEPSRCVVFEDAPKGVESAGRAGMKAVVIETMHDREEFEDYPNILLFIKDYLDPALETLFPEKR